MVIGEALNTIKDLEKTRAYLQGKVQQKVYVLPDELSEKLGTDTVDSLIDAYMAVAKKITVLKAAIIETNVKTVITVTNGDEQQELNLVQVIKYIENLRNTEKVYRELVDSIDNRSNRFYGYGEEQVEMKPNFDNPLDTYVGVADNLRSLARECERQLIKANWVTELVD